MTRTVAGGEHASVAGHGLRVVPPERWEARLFLRDLADRQEGETVRPVLHAANFALRPGRGDFGSGAVETMGPAHAFVALLEYGGAEADTPLFATRGLPRLRVRDFAADALQRKLPGQLGCQRFCTVASRAWCVYVVLGSRRHAAQLVGEVQRVLDSIVMED